MGAGVLSVLGVALAVAIATDVTTGRIRCAVVLPALLACLALHAIDGGWGPAVGGGVASALIGAVIGAAPFVVFALVRAVGWGVVALMAMVGSAVGFPAILACLFGIGVAGALHASVALVARAWARNRRRRSERLAPNRAASAIPAAGVRTTIPYAVAIALGTGWGVWMTMG